MELFPEELSQISSSTPVRSNENGSSRKLEEKDLIGQLDGHSGDDSGVDCTLSLRFPPGSSCRKDGTSSSNVGFVVAPTQPFPRLNGVFGHSNVNPMQAVIGSFTKAGHAGTATPIIVRKCLVCGTTQTPLWRNGPHGLKSLCNACGIRFKKEERRALMNGMIHSRVKPDSAHGKNDPELLKSSKKPKFQLPSNSSSQI